MNDDGDDGDKFLFFHVRVSVRVLQVLQNLARTENYFCVKRGNDMVMSVFLPLLPKKLQTKNEKV